VNLFYLFFYVCIFFIFIAVAATMVGSINFSCTCPSHVLSGTQCLDGACMVNTHVNKFDELGYFAFGGSTTLVLFQPGAIEFDMDLLQNSNQQMETLVQVGDSIGKSTMLHSSPSPVPEANK
jgi:phosphatidylserine decarboxylase